MAVTRKSLTETQRRLLVAILNRIIPPRGQMPGAGELGVSDFVEGVIGQNIPQRRLFLEGLTQIEIAAATPDGPDFWDLPRDAQDTTLQLVEASHPAFFAELVRQTFNGYYTNPQVFDLIGYDRSIKYEPPPFDQSLLDPQRQRASFWRQV